MSTGSALAKHLSGPSDTAAWLPRHVDPFRPSHVQHSPLSASKEGSEYFPAAATAPSLSRTHVAGDSVRGFHPINRFATAPVLRRYGATVHEKQNSAANACARKWRLSKQKERPPWDTRSPQEGGFYDPRLPKYQPPKAHWDSTGYDHCMSEYRLQEAEILSRRAANAAHAASEQADKAAQISNAADSPSKAWQLAADYLKAELSQARLRIRVAAPELNLLGLQGKARYELKEAILDMLKLPKDGVSTSLELGPASCATVLIQVKPGSSELHAEAMKKLCVEGAQNHFSFRGKLWDAHLQVILADALLFRMWTKYLL